MHDVTLIKFIFVTKIKVIFRSWNIVQIMQDIFIYHEYVYMCIS